MISKLRNRWPLIPISVGTLMLLVGFQNCQQAPSKDDQAARLELKKMLDSNEAYSLYGAVLSSRYLDSSQNLLQTPSKSLSRSIANFDNSDQTEAFDFSKSVWNQAKSSTRDSSGKSYTLRKAGWVESKSEQSNRVSWESENVASIQANDDTEVGKVKLIDYWNPAGIEILGALEELDPNRESFYGFKYFNPPTVTSEKLRFSEESLVYQLQYQIKEVYHLYVDPQYLQYDCIKDKTTKCLQKLDQITSARIQLNFNSKSYELEPQANGTVKVFSSNSSYAGPFDVQEPSLGSWQRKTVNGVDLIIIKPPIAYLEKSSSELILAVEMNGYLMKGLFIPEREKVSYLYNKAFTDDVAKMMSKYEISQ